MGINLTSVFVDDRDKALKLDTHGLPFVKRADVPAGPFEWLAVLSPEAPDCVELLLEPIANPATRAFKKAMYEQGIPAKSFGVDDTRR